ncbi:hypothetical protein AAC387_Pa09g0419 [Persea americana]
MDPSELRGAATETGEEEEGAKLVTDPDGETSVLGLGPASASGFGGLRFDGIVGIKSPGEGATPLGEGSRGLMSGASSGGSGTDIGASGSNAGAADMVFTPSREEDRDGVAMVVKKTTIAK